MSKYFSLKEFTCKDGTAVPAELKANCIELMENLDVLRDYLGVPVQVLSGYRTPAWNAKVGGKKASYHMKAMAGDIVTKEHTPAYVYNAIELLISQKKMKQGGLGLYKGFVHYDIRGRKARW